MYVKLCILDYKTQDYINVIPNVYSILHLMVHKLFGVKLNDKL
jgi:hypothetical protein